MNCTYCEEPILESERVPDLSNTHHQECLFRTVIGSAAHLLRECTCFGGTREDPPEMSKREAAKLALSTYHMLERNRK